MAKISVIIPVYNVENYLRECVDSVLGQTFRDFELILIDDGSPDGSGKICDEYAESDKRVTVFHQENGGQAKARNAGLDYVFANRESEWIAFIDSDDRIHPRYLELLYDAAVKNGVNISACDYKETAGENVFNDIEKPASVLIPIEEFFRGHHTLCVVPWGKLCKKELFKGVRYPEGKIHEDEFVTYRIMFGSGKIAHVAERMYAYFKNPSGTMGSKWSPKRYSVLQAYDEQIDYFKKNGFEYAEKKIIDTYAYICCQWMEEINREGVYRDELKIISRLLRKHLRKYKKEANFSFKNNPWYYYNAYPRFARILRKLIKT